MDTSAITHAIDQQEWLDPVADALQNTAASAFDAMGEAGTPVKKFLHGTWLGHPLHAAVTDWPVGAWTVAAVLDLADVVGSNPQAGRGADLAIGVGMVGAGLAAVSGLTDYHVLGNRRDRRVGAMHALLNVGISALYGASMIVRRSGNRPLGRALGWTAFGTLVASAYLGGTLVYHQRIGVDHAPRQNLPENWIAALPEAELTEGEMRNVDVEGTAVLLARHEGKIYALANRCAHLGGPLDEGEMKDGCVTCPWHGSTYRLDDGSVETGPTVYPQPVFEIRIRDGMIELRAPDKSPELHTASRGSVM
jgi:nitrite reductase/ring-hydroxylating ferredoxin subunit/uncharacterized membrane protein